MSKYVAVKYTAPYLHFYNMCHISVRLCVYHLTSTSWSRGDYGRVTSKQHGSQTSDRSSRLRFNTQQFLTMSVVTNICFFNETSGHVKPALCQQNLVFFYVSQDIFLILTKRFIVLSQHKVENQTGRNVKIQHVCKLPTSIQGIGLSVSKKWLGKKEDLIKFLIVDQRRQVLARIRSLCYATVEQNNDSRKLYLISLTGGWSSVE